MNEWWINGGCTIVMYRGTSSATTGTNSVVSRSPVITLAYLGRSTDSANPPVVAMNI